MAPSKVNQTMGAEDQEACFIIMPISDPEGYASGHFRRVYEDIIKPACEMASFKAVRADDVTETNLIHVDILRKIIEAPLSICDLSGHNPNVMFELGLRQAFDLPVVLIQASGTGRIFDLNGIRTHEYPIDLNYRDVLASQRNIAEAMKQTMTAKASGRSTNSIVSLLSLTSAALPPVEQNQEDIRFSLIMSQLEEIKNKLANGHSAASDRREATLQELEIDIVDLILRMEIIQKKPPRTKDYLLEMEHLDSMARAFEDRARAQGARNLGDILQRRQRIKAALSDARIAWLESEKEA